MTNELLAEIALLKEQNKKLVEERRAAVSDMLFLIAHPLEVCELCKHHFADNDTEICPTCSDNTIYGNFEWRSVSSNS